VAEQAEELLADLLARLDTLSYRDHQQLDGLIQRTDMIIRRVFGETSEYRSRLTKIGFSPMVYPADEKYHRSSWLGGVSEFRNLIQTMIDERKLFGVEPAAGAGQERAKSGAVSDGAQTVFLVHGHNERVKAVVARFLEKLRLNVVILHEKPSAGRTIIEKFEAESAPAAFAVILLTDDDFGGAQNGEAHPRARQNVVFEMGYFVGVLSREKVAALVTPGLELPGDYSGVVYITLEGESWKLELAKEMRHAGIEIDMNRAL
jgi:predicted nucleotide-binding protein